MTTNAYTLPADDLYDDESDDALHIEDALLTIMSLAACMDADDREATGLDAPILEGARFTTFDHAGLLTTDAGVVIRLPGGAEFQVSIVQSKRAR